MHRLHFQNELMTPVVSNGNNYLTYLSASILESTYLGKLQVLIIIVPSHLHLRPWYKFDKKVVREESRQYWYGRSWGCSFAMGSCYDYMQDPETRLRGSLFPFCNEDDLRNFLLYRKPKEICFSNGEAETRFNVTCNLMKSLVQPTGQFEVIFYSRFLISIYSVANPIASSVSPASASVGHHWVPSLWLGQLSSILSRDQGVSRHL